MTCPVCGQDETCADCQRHNTGRARLAKATATHAAQQAARRERDVADIRADLALGIPPERAAADVGRTVRAVYQLARRWNYHDLALIYSAATLRAERAA